MNNSINETSRSNFHKEFNHTVINIMSKPPLDIPGGATSKECTAGTLGARDEGSCDHLYSNNYTDIHAKNDPMVRIG